MNAVRLGNLDIRQRGDSGFGYDKKVYWCNGGDVAEGKAVLIFVQYVSLDLRARMIISA